DVLLHGLGGEMMKKGILLVEDNADDEALTVRALEKGGVVNEIAIARDGAEARDYLFGTGKYQAREWSQKPQVILVDLKLHKIAGLDAVKVMRADERTKLIPVVILTSSREDRDIMEGYKLGANSFVVKPVDMAQFNSAVQQLGMFWLLLNER